MCIYIHKKKLNELIEFYSLYHNCKMKWCKMMFISLLFISPSLSLTRISSPFVSYNYSVNDCFQNNYKFWQTLVNNSKIIIPTAFKEDNTQLFHV